eukprot:54188-Eustigmatos_ZCMA.PRE.1
MAAANASAQLKVRSSAMALPSWLVPFPPTTQLATLSMAAWPNTTDLSSAAFDHADTRSN